MGTPSKDEEVERFHETMAQAMIEIPFIDAGKRLGISWPGWMGDWFISHSPRNANTNAEGPWSEWVDLAQMILNDPLTQIARPEMYQSVPPPDPDYSGAAKIGLEQLYDRLHDLDGY